MQIDGVGRVVVGGDGRGVDSKVGPMGAGPERLNLARLIALVRGKVVVGVVREVDVRDALGSGSSMLTANTLEAVQDGEALDRGSIRLREALVHLLLGGKLIPFVQGGKQSIRILDLHAVVLGRMNGDVGRYDRKGALHADERVEHRVVPVAEGNQEIVLREIALVGLW